MTAKELFPRCLTLAEQAAAIKKKLDVDLFPPATERELRAEADRLFGQQQNLHSKASALGQVDQKLAQRRCADVELKGLGAIRRELGERASAVQAELAHCAAADRRRLERELELVVDVADIIECGGIKRTMRAYDGSLFVETIAVDDPSSWRPPRALQSLWEKHNVPLDATCHAGPLRRRVEHRRALLGRRGQLVKEIEALLESLGQLA